MVFRVRELLIRQRTQAINALRGHLTEFGHIVPQGAANTSKLIAVVEDPDSGILADAIATLKGLCCTNRLIAGRPLSPDRLIPRPL